LGRAPAKDPNVNPPAFVIVFSQKVRRPAALGQERTVRHVSMRQEIHLPTVMGLALFEVIGSVVIVVGKTVSSGERSHRWPKS